MRFKTWGWWVGASLNKNKGGSDTSLQMVAKVQYMSLPERDQRYAEW